MMVFEEEIKVVRATWQSHAVERVRATSALPAPPAGLARVSFQDEIREGQISA